MSYGRPGTLERAYNPYARLDALGDTSQPFDLRSPAAVLELKHALVALAQHGSDPLKVSDPIQEDRWKRIQLTGPGAAGWEGPAADELVAAISRHAKASGIAPPYIQLGGSSFGKYGIVGGPQPTAHGLEVIAGAVQTLLGGAPQMTQYLAWRDGTFKPPSSVSKPPENAQVNLVEWSHPYWDQESYTPAWPEGDPIYVKAAEQLDDALVACWQQLAEMTDATEEQRRLAIDECILPVRAQRHEAVLLANKGAPAPSCPTGQRWDKALAQCVVNTGIVDLPPVGAEECVQAYMELEGKSEAEAREICMAPKRSGAGVLSSAGGAVAVGALAGAAIWYMMREQKKRRSLR